jgi:hypothetical protein
MASVLEVKSIIKSMKETRWDDPFMGDVELDESDDELAEQSKQTLLSSDDPRLLEEVTQDALGDALSILGEGFSKIVGHLTDTPPGEDQVAKTIFVLRVVREINDRIPNLRVLDTSMPHTTPFTKEILRPLYIALAKQIVQPVLASYQKSLHSGMKSKSKSDNLWEGSPPLPALPSSGAFRFLQQLVKSMGKHGSDLWVPEGVVTLKGLAAEQISSILTGALEKLKQTEPQSASDQSAEDGQPDDDGEVGKAEGADQEKSAENSNPSANSPDTAERNAAELKQLAFDSLYILWYLDAAQGTASLDPLADSVCDAAGVDQNMKARLRKSAGDYARKTYLLFALLA